MDADTADTSVAGAVPDPAAAAAYSLPVLRSHHCWINPAAAPNGAMHLCPVCTSMAMGLWSGDAQNFGCRQQAHDNRRQKGVFGVLSIM